MRMGPAASEAARLLGDSALLEEPLGPRTTYRSGGCAAVAVQLSDPSEIARVSDVVRRSKVEVLVVGNGSNMLVADAGFDGLAVLLGDGFDEVDIAGQTVRAGAGVALPTLARRLAKAGLTGFEWAVGVPGSIGGAVRMNAGGHGSEMSAVLRRVRVADLVSGEDIEVKATDLGLDYRRSSLRSSQLVVWAELALEPDVTGEAESRIKEIVRWRRENQPGGQNAGSVFTNPPGDAAGRLIDAAGARGLRIGTAEVSPKHANFIQSDAGGSADDIWALMVEVRRLVAEATGIVLHPETHLVGFPPLPEVVG